MRGLIIDYARSRQAQKRGGGFEITSLGDDVADPTGRRRGARAGSATALDELAAVDPPLAEVVDLKFFCGFSFAEIARHARRVGAHRAAALGEGAHRTSTARFATRLT